jgi:hypothetical protein
MNTSAFRMTVYDVLTGKKNLDHVLKLFDGNSNQTGTLAATIRPILLLANKSGFLFRFSGFWTLHSINN